MSSLENKNVVIVGGTSGIGLAVSKLAVDEGAKVWALGRSQRYIDQAAKLLGANATCESVDIHDAEALKKIFSKIGTIDHLVGNATGANRTIAPFMEQSAEQFSEAFGKFWGYMNLVRTGVPFMSKQGSIVLTSGTPARKCRPGQISLSCVGNAVEGFVRAFAPEVAPIRVNVVAPGIIDTTMYSWMGEDKDNKLAAMTSQQAIKRAGKPEEVAMAMIYLMKNDYVTGTTMDVEGGLLLP